MGARDKRISLEDWPTLGVQVSRNKRGPDSANWKVKMDSPKLSPDLHTHTPPGHALRVCAHAHTRDSGI